MPPVILAIDTSGMCGTVAIRRDGQLLDERELEQSRRRHAQTLISEIQDLLAAHEIKSTDVDVVAVSHGPGSFTGLRVGIVFAKSFAFATGCRIVAVDTLEAVSAAVTGDEWQSVNSLSIISDAQREQLFVEEFQRTNEGAWNSTGPIHIVDFDDWVTDVTNRADGSFAVGGPGLSKLAGQLPDTLRRMPDEQWNPRAAQVAMLAERRALSEEFADPFELEPFYLRKSSAEEKRDAKLASNQS